MGRIKPRTWGAELSAKSAEFASNLQRHYFFVRHVLQPGIGLAVTVPLLYVVRGGVTPDDWSSIASTMGWWQGINALVALAYTARYWGQ